MHSQSAHSVKFQKSITCDCEVVDVEHADPEQKLVVLHKHAVHGISLYSMGIDSLDEWQVSTEVLEVVTPAPQTPHDNGHSLLISFPSVNPSSQPPIAANCTHEASEPSTTTFVSMLSAHGIDVDVKAPTVVVSVNMAVAVVVSMVLVLGFLVIDDEVTSVVERTAEVWVVEGKKPQVDPERLAVESNVERKVVAAVPLGVVVGVFPAAIPTKETITPANRE